MRSFALIGCGFFTALGLDEIVTAEDRGEGLVLLCLAGLYGLVVLLDNKFKNQIDKGDLL